MFDHMNATPHYKLSKPRHDTSNLFYSGFVPY